MPTLITNPRQAAEHKFAAAFSPLAVDQDNGVIGGVAIITEGWVLGHTDFASGLRIFADAVTLQQIMDSAQTYETGLKVKADHGSGIFAVCGFLNNFRIDGPVLRGDLTVLKTDPNYSKLFEMARMIPDAFGLSVSFSGADEVTLDRCLARCTEIYSADLVSEPAANPTGLFARRKVDGAGKVNMAVAKPASPAPAQDAPAAKGTPDNAPLPSPDDILTQCKAMASACQAAVDGIQKQMAKYAEMEAAVNKLKPDQANGNPDADLEPKPGSTSDGADKEKNVPFSMAAVREELREFKTNFAMQLAKEFAATVGRSPAPAAAPAASTDHPEKVAGTPEQKFEAAVQKHFAKSKSQRKALSAAIAEEPAGYDAMITSGKRINYEARAA